MVTQVGYISLLGLPLVIIPGPWHGTINPEIKGEYVNLRGPLSMKHKRLDISGKTGPYCFSVVEKEAKALCRSGELFITCDNFPAVTTLIPRIARDESLSCDVRRSTVDLFEIRLART